MKKAIFFLVVICFALGMSSIAFTADIDQDEKGVVLHAMDYAKDFKGKVFYAKDLAKAVINVDNISGCLAVDCGQGGDPVLICFKSLSEFTAIVSEVCAPYMPDWIARIINPGGWQMREVKDGTTEPEAIGTEKILQFKR